jgi:hypothetical protein
LAARRISKKMGRAVLQTSIMITSCVFLVALCEEEFSTRSTASASIPGGTRDTTNDKKTAPSWVYLLRSLQEEEQNFWTFLLSLIPCLISILFNLVPYLCRRHRNSYSEELSDPRILFQKGEDLVREMKGALEFMRGVQQGRRQLQNAMDSLERIKKEENERFDKLKCESDLSKMMMKVHNDRHDRFQRDMESSKKAIKVNNYKRDRIQNEIHSFKKMMNVKAKSHDPIEDETNSIKMMMIENERLAPSPNEGDLLKNMRFTEKTVDDPASMESPDKMKGSRKNRNVASKAAGEKEETLRMNKVRVALAPPPNLKTVTAKVVSLANTIHRPGESHVKISNRKPDYSNIQPKVDSWRKKQMKGDGDNNASDNKNTRYGSLAGNCSGRADLRREQQSTWRANTVRTEPQGRKARPITDGTSQAIWKRRNCGTPVGSSGRIT